MPMTTVVDEYKPYFQALRAYNRQAPDVRRRVAGDYFDIAATAIEGPGRALLVRYGYRERARPPREERVRSS